MPSYGLSGGFSASNERQVRDLPVGGPLVPVAALVVEIWTGRPVHLTGPNGYFANISAVPAAMDTKVRP